MKKVIGPDIDATIIRQLANKDCSGVANAIWRHQSIRESVLTKVHSEINKESSALCSDKEPSLLRKTKVEELMNFSEQKSEKELSERAPTLYGCLQSCIVNQKKKPSQSNLSGCAPSIILQHPFY